MALVVTAVLLTSMTLLYGHMILSKPIVGEKVRVSVVQGNIDQSNKWNPKYEKFIMQTYADLTREAVEDGPALIIWPETATPRAINHDARLYRQVNSIASKAGVYLLLGSAQRRKFKRDDDDKGTKYHNSAFLIYPESGQAKNQRYDKIRLFPFGEYLPMKEIIPWSYIKIPDVSGYGPGEEFTVFEVPTFRFGVTICWENVFPDLVSQFVRRGAQFMVNIGNEARFGKTSASHHFVTTSVFRAVENRVYVVRCANTGVSCFIDPYGRVVDRVTDKNGRDIFVRGILTKAVIPLESNTFYTRYGDWLAWMSFFVALAFLIVGFTRKKQDLGPVSDGT